MSICGIVDRRCIDFYRFVRRAQEKPDKPKSKRNELFAYWIRDLLPSRLFQSIQFGDGTKETHWVTAKDESIESRLREKRNLRTSAWARARRVWFLSAFFDCFKTRSSRVIVHRLLELCRRSFRWPKNELFEQRPPMKCFVWESKVCRLSWVHRDISSSGAGHDRRDTARSRFVYLMLLRSIQHQPFSCLNSWDAWHRLLSEMLNRLPCDGVNVTHIDPSIEWPIVDVHEIIIKQATFMSLLSLRLFY